MNQTIAVLFGGRSGEHEVSVQSAINIIRELKNEKLHIIPVGIDKKGNWRIATDRQSLYSDDDSSCVSTQAQVVIPVTRDGGGISLQEANSEKTLHQIDVVFSIIHGSFGEDGSMQGLLHLFDVPFVGAGVLGSAIGMDKDVSKRLLRDANIPVCRFVTVHSSELPDISFDVLANQLAVPFYVKPCNLGSSVGIHRVENPQQFEQALADAFLYDSKLIIEESVEGRELECAVLGNQSPQASVPGEIRISDGFYSYQKKYQNPDAVELCIPADLSAKTAADVQKLAVRVFEVLQCSGMARVDFFLRSSDNQLLVNEINTLPGFTKVSMYPKLWEASGKPYGRLLIELIELAIARHSELKKLKRDFESE